MNWTLNITETVALWGGLTGSLSLIISYFAYKRDDLDIRLELRKGWKIHNSPVDDPNKLYSSLSVYNRGRRPVIITQAGYSYLKINGGAILSDSMIYGKSELKEGAGVDFLIDEEQLGKISEISYFAAYDAAGRTYKMYIAPFYSRFFYWLLDFTRIKRKQKAVSSK